MRALVKRYGYVRDPVCLVACALYALNRWCLPASLKGPFLRGHFDDLLLIPAALPLVLWVQRRLRIRAAEGPPSWTEIGLHLVVWSIAAEVIGPRMFPHVTGDAWDLVAYATGAVLAGLIWNAA